MNYKHAYPTFFTDFNPVLFPGLYARVKQGQHDCHSCQKPLTLSTASIAGRMFFPHQHVEICICNNCLRKAGSFKKAVWHAVEEFQRECMPDGGAIIDMDDIHPTAGNC